MLGKFDRELFKKLMKERKIKQSDIARILTDDYGINTSLDTVKSWTRKNNPNTPDDERIKVISRVLNVPPYELDTGMGGYKEQIALDLLKTPTAKLKEAIRQYAPVSTEDTVEIPFYEEAVAGAGSEAFYPEYLHESEKISISKRFLNGVNPKYLMFFQIVGDSMEPTIHINDWVLIELVADRDFYPVTGIYLIDMDGSVQLKRLEFRGEKGIDIISDNQAYGTKNTVRDDIQIKIIGKLFMHLRHYGPLALVEKEEE